ncbi:hypothetical protein [Rhizobium sp. FKY42]|uniref:hypothetical protein n=1 Tax=Rhizobium sp. FKY42 TaxID=2562310 RepID=UPI0010C13203|nr:hypothetical protein [Rhizobium sp. FKY42]
MAKQPAKTTEKLKDNETLNGSNTFPDLIEIAPDLKLQLGEVVFVTQQESGLSVEQWNALPETERDVLLSKAISAMVLAAKDNPDLSTKDAPVASQMMIGEQVLIVSAPAGPRRRAGISFGPVPVELRGEDLGDDPVATVEALRADPYLKIDGRYEERPADETD